MRDHFINGNVVRFDWKPGEYLEVEADANFECLRHLCEKSIVVASATAESLIPIRERDAGDDSEIHSGGFDLHAWCRKRLPELPPSLDELGNIVHLAQFEGASIDTRINDPFLARHTELPEQIKIWFDDLGCEKHYSSCSCKFWMSNKHSTDRLGYIAAVCGSYFHKPHAETFSEIRFFHRSDSNNVARSVHFSKETPLDSLTSHSRA